MKLSEMKINDEIVAEELASDAEFRAEWERTATARAVALSIIQYRAERALSQRELASLLGLKQPQVARLEAGDVNPSVETLTRISSRLAIDVMIEFRPADLPTRHVSDGRSTDILSGVDVSVALRDSARP